MDSPRSHQTVQNSPLPPLPAITSSQSPSAASLARRLSNPLSPSPSLPMQQHHSRSPGTALRYHQPHTRSHSSSSTALHTPPRRPQPLPRAGAGSSADIVLPEWQPDAAAKTCPICTSIFTFFNRRHHCRKCGRVVCASCSPHRIAIPAAFVVKPPPQIIDLTSSSPQTQHQQPTSWMLPPSPDTNNDYPDDDDNDDDDDDESALVRICDECLGRQRPSRSVSNPSTSTFTFTSSSAVSVPRDSRRRRQSTQGGRSLPPPRPPLLPQFAETDYCPVCHRALPYLTDSSDAGREAHVASCIASATSPAPSPAPHHHSNNNHHRRGRERSYTNGGRMVVWLASEQDCREPGVECVICFEEFELSQEIARLECLCRYHKKCICSWFDRKGNGECPVHAIHE